MQIKAIDLTHIYDQNTPSFFKALNNVNMDIPSHGIIAFIGHTGSGKTSMIKHFNGFLLPTEGEIKIDDFTFNDQKKKRKVINSEISQVRKKVGMVFQFPEDQIFEETVEKEITFGIKALKIPKDNLENKVNEVMQLVGLETSFKNKNPFELSGGEKRRVALASALILDQEVIILDEPTASLDNDGIKEIYSLIIKIAFEKKRQIIIVTHDLRNVLEYADYVFVFSNTQVVAQGEPIDIMYNIELLEKHQLEIPKLVKLTSELKKANINLPRTKTIDEFVHAYTQYKKDKNGK